jgi:hypothetical protein
MGSELMHIFNHCKFSVINYLASFQVKEHLLLELLMIMVMVGQLKALAAAGAEILVGTFVKFIRLDALVSNYSGVIKILQALNIFETSLRRGRFDESRKCVHLINSSLSMIFFRKENILASALINAYGCSLLQNWKKRSRVSQNKVLRHKDSKRLKTSTRKQFYY